MSDIRWYPDVPHGHARYCVSPYHSLMRYCAASPDEPATMRGEPSRAWLRDHPQPDQESATMKDTTITATDISRQPAREDDTELSVLVMRTCTLLAVRRDGRPAGHYDISRADWETITRIPRPDGEPAPDPAARVRELERTIELLLAYGTARFGDEWWPGNARNHMPDGRELEYLLDPGSAELADRADTRSGEAS